MSDSNVESNHPETLADALKLADSCKQNLAELGDLQREFHRAFHERERVLSEQLTRLQGFLVSLNRERTFLDHLTELRSLIEQMPLPLADDQPTAAHEVAENRNGDLAAPPAPTTQETITSKLPENDPAPAPEVSSVAIEDAEHPPETVESPPSEPVPAPALEVAPTDALAVRAGVGNDEPRSPPPGDAALTAKKRTEEEVKEALKTRYPAFTKLFTAGQYAKQLIQAVSPSHLPRLTLETITAAFVSLRDKLIAMLDNEEGGRNALREEARKLMNQLQILDKHLETSSQMTAEKLQQLRQVRNGLWAFVQSATDNEYVELSPPAKTHIAAWAKQYNPLTEDKIVETKQIPYPSYPKDHVVKTLRPGYVQMTADRKHVAQIIARACVQISTGSVT